MGKVYKMVVRPAVMHGLKVVVPTKKLKVLRFSLEVTGINSIRNQYIRGTVEQFGVKVTEARL